MSSWVGEWERGITNRRGNPAKYRTDCKLGRHPILVDMPALWVSDSTLAPLGLSCVPCVKERAAGLGREVPVEAPAPKVKPEPEKGPRHGTSYSYNRLKCRCVPCTAANTEANARWRAKRPQKAKA